jgi:flagellar hook protein FlgE
VITLHTGTTSTLDVSSSNPGALAALGFSAPVNLPRGGGGTIGTGQLLGNDNSTFLDESVAGGAVTTYDVSGAPVNLQFRWGKIDSASLGAGHTDTWNLFYQVNPNATGVQTAWQNVNQNFSFSASGQMTPTIASVTLTNCVVNGVALGNPVVNFGTGGVTQFADANGNVQVNQIQQDGFPAGKLQSVGVSTNGRIVGNYSNGRNLDLAEISVATFNGTNFLKRIDGGAFEATDESGQALYGKSGTIVGSSLESSNTDIADEFTKLIVTQQAYSANTKVITTSNTMVQDLLNVLR